MNADNTAIYVHRAYTEINPLTGLLFNKAFLERADEFIKTLQPGKWCLIAMDIEHFKLFNKLFGREEGDRLLIYVADCMREIEDTYRGLAGYMGGDNYCVILPDDQQLIKQLHEKVSEGVKRVSNTVGFLPAFGVYCIKDCTMSAITMYDRAAIALSQVIGNYAKRISYYDSSMVEELEEEIMLISEVQRGIEEDEFTFYLQPQCDMTTGKIVGAESLVRWIHKEIGIISPALFIPVLEKNGIIADLDRFIWEKVCRWLKSCIQRGYTPVPIAINVSRIDVLSMDVPAHLMGLLDKYQLNPKFLKVEITEGIYSENDEIKQVVRQLQEVGLQILMDDFGSGYSSLNMLKNVSVNGIKLDMKFLDMDETVKAKGISILETIVNLSRQMGLPVIVEGVETKEQEEFLIEMGCRYAQGYLYYKPMPFTEFEKKLASPENLDLSGFWSKQVAPFQIREFLDNNLFSDTILNNLLGPAAFYDVYENNIEITRVNEQYHRLAGIVNGSESGFTPRLWNHVLDSDRQKLLAIFDDAYKHQVTGAQGNFHYQRVDGRILKIFLRLFFVRERDGHKIFYGSLTDITALSEEKKGKRIIR